MWVLRYSSETERKNETSNESGGKIIKILQVISLSKSDKKTFLFRRKLEEKKRKKCLLEFLNFYYFLEFVANTMVPQQSGEKTLS